MLFTAGLFIGGLVSAAMAGLILVSLASNPRLWAGDAPKVMQEAITPLTPEEKRTRSLWAIPIFGVAFIVPFAAAFRYEATQGQLNFFEAYAFLWLIYMVFNVVDLVIIDWLVVVWWHPAWSTMPEVAHLRHLNNYSYHFKAFLKGTVGISILSLIGAVIVALL